jgi:hypothetical protein
VTSRTCLTTPRAVVELRTTRARRDDDDQYAGEIAVVRKSERKFVTEVEMRKLLIAGSSLAMIAGCTVQRDYVPEQDPFTPSAPSLNNPNDPIDELDEPDDQPIDEPNEEEPPCYDCYGAGTTFDASDGRVTGDIGNFVDLDLPVSTPTVYEDPSWGYTDVTLTGYRDDGAMGMIILEIMNVNPGDLEEGSHECTGYDGSSGEQIMVTACATGNSDADYYDAPATECEVIITDTDEGREVVVQAVIPHFNRNYEQDGSTRASGSFVMTMH